MSSSKTLTTIIRENHHRFRFFIVFVFAIVVSLGSFYYQNLISSRTESQSITLNESSKTTIESAFGENPIGQVRGGAGFLDAINQNLSGFKGTDLSVQRLVNFLKSFACYFIRFAIVTLSVMIIVYGIMFLQSRGSPQGMMSSRKALIWGLVGGIVIFGVFTIILSVANLIGVSYPIFSC